MTPTVATTFTLSSLSHVCTVAESQDSPGIHCSPGLGAMVVVRGPRAAGKPRLVIDGS